jgi:DNA-binding CsgD family transcriptional regulator
VSACTGADRGEQDQEHSGRGEQAVASDGQDRYPAAGWRCGCTRRGGDADSARLAAGKPERREGEAESGNRNEQPAPHAIPQTPSPAEVLVAYGLTGRELAVLRLVAAGRTNAQIGAELFISPRTAGVHVTSILRKLGVTNRVQAAALAERAGLLPARQS